MNGRELVNSKSVRFNKISKKEVALALSLLIAISIFALFNENYIFAVGIIVLGPILVLHGTRSHIVRFKTGYLLLKESPWSKAIALEPDKISSISSEKINGSDYKFVIGIEEGEVITYQVDVAYRDRLPEVKELIEITSGIKVT